MELTLRADCERAVSVGTSRCGPDCVVINLLDDNGEVFGQAHFSIAVGQAIIDDIARCSAGEVGRFH